MQSPKLTAMESSAERSEPTSEPLDLSAIAARHPVNVHSMTLDLATFDASALTLLEVLDMSEVAGVEPTELAKLLARPSTDTTKARMLYALAWVIVKRERPEIKYSEIITWKLNVVGKIDNAKTKASTSRARARVNAATLSGLPPKEAEKLTVAELQAYRDNRPKTRRATPRARRR
jgi:hypothetical protein